MAGRKVINIPVINNNNTECYSPASSATAPPTSPQFIIRDNRTFRHSPSPGFYENGEVTNSGGYLAPPTITCRSSVSPQRIILTSSRSAHRNGLNGATSAAPAVNHQQETRREKEFAFHAHNNDGATIVPISRALGVTRPPSRPEPSQAFSRENTYSSFGNPVLPVVCQNAQDNNKKDSNPAAAATYGSTSAHPYQSFRPLQIHSSSSDTKLSTRKADYGEPESSDATIYSTIGAVNISNSLNTIQPAAPPSFSDGGVEEKLVEESEPAVPVAAWVPAPPPPPPPPPPIPAGGIPSLPKSTLSNGDSPKAMPISGLAAAIQSATLRKTPKVETSGIPAPLVGAKAVLMEEMQRKLARRKAKVDGEDAASTPVDCSARSSPFLNRRSNTSSPRPFLKSGSKLGSTAEVGESLPDQLEQLKQELLYEIRREMTEFKCDLLEAIKVETSCKDTTQRSKHTEF